jgi:tetratricopeptide (TPR) repeat protein
MDKPKPYDAVIGNSQTPNTPYNALVLGGIEGAKQRLNTGSLPVKLEALISIFKYGKDGLGIIHKFFRNETDPLVKWFALNWLWQKAPETVRIDSARHITCLKNVNPKLVSVTLTLMVNNVNSNWVVQIKSLLNKIENSHKISSNYLSIRYKELGDLYYLIIGQGLLSDDIFKAAIATYQELIKYNKDSYLLPDILTKRGYINYYFGQYQEAIEDCSQAIKINSYFAWAYNIRGMTYHKLCENHLAIKDYNQAITMRSDYEAAYYNRGNTYRDLGDTQAAIEDYNQAIKIDPNYARAYENRGYTYHKLGNYQEAINDYNKSIQLAPDANTYNNRGNVYYDLGDNPAAIEDYNQAIKLNPNLAWAYNNRGLSRYALNEYQVAIEDFCQAIQINPNYENAYYNRGLSYANLENHQAAIADYNQALQIKATYTKIYYDRGLAYYNLGDYQASIRDYSEAIKFNCNLANSYWGRAMAYAKIGQVQAAILDYTQAANLFKEQGKEYEYQDMLSRALKLKK